MDVLSRETLPAVDIPRSPAQHIDSPVVVVVLVMVV